MIRGWLLLVFLLSWTLCFGQKQFNDYIRIETALAKKLNQTNDVSALAISVSFKRKSAELLRKFHLTEQFNAANIYTGRLRRAEILALLQNTDVIFISEHHAPKEELTTGAVDYTLNRVNLALHLFPTIKGDSIVVAVKERAFDTTDIDLKGRIVSSGLKAQTQTVHAAIMATIIAGAGNSSPFALGVAPAAAVASIDFANLFPEANEFYGQKKVSVQNHSFGTTVENFYGNEAVAYDMNARTHPSLLHVFSAGNSGTVTPTTGPYAGLLNTANLTGNFKQSKNSISVGALDSLGTPMLPSSRGPAYDGRIKPELSAYGEDGSSGAAAIVSGAAALLQDAYRKKYGQLPTSDLVKAVMINSADDVGPSGIDYATGYGSLNAGKALQGMQQNQFFQGQVTQGEVKPFSLSVPTNTRKLKLTLTWTDTAAQPNAAKALVNDLDLVLKDITTGQVYQPWVLNPKPNSDSLSQPAQRKKDTLNNVEQITINAPPASGYLIEVSGSKLANHIQQFALSYQFDTTVFSWTYPTASDPLLAGTTQLLRWNAATGGTALLDYSYDGTNWQSIANGIDLSAGHYKWAVPDTLATAMLRMMVSGNEFRSDSFVISLQLNLKVGFNCTDSFLLYWKEVNASHYQLKQLGKAYLEPFSTTTDTAQLIGKNQVSSRYFTVTPTVGGKAGFRSQAIPFDGAGVECYFVAFYLQSQTLSAAFFTAELGTLFNVKELSLQKRLQGEFVSFQTTKDLNGSSFRFTDSALLKGENHYRLKLALQNGTVLYSNEEKVYHIAESPVYVYPNPVRRNESLKVISNEAGRYTIRIMNSSGAEVYSQFITNTNFTLSTAAFPSGLYFVWIMDKQGKAAVQKLLIQ